MQNQAAGGVSPYFADLIVRVDKNFMPALTTSRRKKSTKTVRQP